MKITKKGAEILSTNRILMLVALDLDVSFYTVNRWVKENDERLTQISVLKSIEKHTNLKPEEVFEFNQ